MNTIDYRYQSLLQDILDNGEKKQTRNGEVLSVFGRQIRHKMSDGFPLLTTKKMYWKGIVAELLWFLKGQTNIKYLLENDCHIWDGDCFANYVKNFTKYVDSLPEDSETEFIINKDKFINKIKTDDGFAAQWGNFGPIYGKQWRRVMVPYNMMVIDQIANLINDLKTDPDSRRLMVNAWNVAELDQMVLPPCHYGFQVYTRELTWGERVRYYETSFGRLHFIPPSPDAINARNIPTRAISLMWSQRSVDTFLGLPFNIASYGLLLCILGELTNMVPDQLIGSLGDVHIYENHIDAVNEQLKRTPLALPKLRLNSESWNPENALGEDNWNAIINEMQIDDFQIEDYESYPAIKAPLSN